MTPDVAAALDRLVREVRAALTSEKRRVAELEYLERFLVARRRTPTVTYSKDFPWAVTLAEKACVALGKIGGTAHVSVIVNEMRRLGFEDQGRSGEAVKNAIYCTMLRNPGRFTRVARGTWELKTEGPRGGL
jgi:hypothetical protein